MATPLNWDRKYRVVFGTPDIDTYVYRNVVATGIVKVGGVEHKIYDGSTIPSNAVSMSNIVGEDDYVGYQFQFKLESVRGMTKSATSSSEKTTLTLYNINQNAIDILNQNGCVVRVYAGYANTELTLAYSGDVTKVTPKYSENDITYQIKCKDGANDSKNTKASIDYSDTMNEKDLILDIINRFPTASRGIIAVDNVDENYVTGGYSHQGPLVDALDYIIYRNNLKCGWFNGRINIVPYEITDGIKDYDNLLVTVFSLRPDIIKDISYVNETSNTATNDSTGKAKIAVNTYYIPVEVGQLITISNMDGTETINRLTEFVGTYNVTGIKTRLDSYGNNWDVALTCTPI